MSYTDLLVESSFYSLCVLAKAQGCARLPKGQVNLCKADTAIASISIFYLEINLIILYMFWYHSIHLFILSGKSQRRWFTPVQQGQQQQQQTERYQLLREPPL